MFSKLSNILFPNMLVIKVINPAIRKVEKEHEFKEKDIHDVNMRNVLELSFIKRNVNEARVTEAHTFIPSTWEGKSR